MKYISSVQVPYNETVEERLLYEAARAVNAGNDKRAERLLKVAGALPVATTGWGWLTLALALAMLAVLVLVVRFGGV